MSNKNPLLLQLIASEPVEVKLRDKVTVGRVDYASGSTVSVSGQAAFRLLMAQKATLTKDLPMPTAQPAEAAESAPTVEQLDEGNSVTEAGNEPAPPVDPTSEHHTPRSRRYSKG